MLTFLNLFFFTFHTLWIGFNMTGWAWRRTRPWTLLTLGLTAFSWFVLGFWYGWGYCVCTEYHFQVRDQLGVRGGETSYIHLLILKLTTLDVPVPVCNLLAVTVFAAAVVLSVTLNLRDWLRSRARRTSGSAHPASG